MALSHLAENDIENVIVGALPCLICGNSGLPKSLLQAFRPIFRFKTFLTIIKKMLKGLVPYGFLEELKIFITSHP